MDGTMYTGVQAIRMDREVTKEYEGILTDDDVTEIAARYGFPTQVKAGFGWLDANYLSRFVTVYLSDGHLSDWDDYVTAGGTIPLTESWLAQHLERDGTLSFGYARGFEKLIDFVQLWAYFASVLLIIALAPLFCEDRQLAVRALIFTTDRGKREDVWARILAAATMAVILFAVPVLLLFLFCGSLYGYGGGQMRTGIVVYYQSFYYMSELPVSVFTALYLMTICGALLMLASCSILISAAVRTTFRSLLVSLILWCSPVFLFLSFRSRQIYFFSSMLPFMLVNYANVIETCAFYALHLLVMAAVTAAGTVCGIRRWGRVDRE